MARLMIRESRKFISGLLREHGGARIRKGITAWDSARAAWDDARRAASEHGLGPLHVFREQRQLKKQYAVDRRSYYQYRLYDPSLPQDDKPNYLPVFGPTTPALWSDLTPPRFRLLYDNKLVFYHFFSSLGFPLAPLYGVFDPEFGHTAAGNRLRSAADLREWMRTSAVDEFVFKPLEGIQGHMVLVFAGRAPDDPEQFVTLSGERYDAERIVEATTQDRRLRNSNPGASTRSFLLEQRMRPHPELAALVGPTLCSIRVQTLIARDGTPQIIAAVFKLQPNPVGVDHLMHGALGCWVDPETGALGRGYSREDPASASVVPGTDRVFEGFRLPRWMEVRELALRAAAAFPWARSIGWDIAVAEDGPVLIEGNERWSPSLIQLPASHGLLRGELRAVLEAVRSGSAAEHSP